MFARRLNTPVLMIVALAVALVLVPHSVWATETCAGTATAPGVLDPLHALDSPSIWPALPAQIHSSQRSSLEYPSAAETGSICGPQGGGDSVPASTIWLSTVGWVKEYRNWLGWVLASHEAWTQWYWSGGSIVASGSLWGVYSTWLGWSWENDQRWWNFVHATTAQALDEVTFALRVSGVTVQSFRSTIVTNVDGWGNSWAW